MAIQNPLPRPGSSSLAAEAMMAVVQTAAVRYGRTRWPAPAASRPRPAPAPARSDARSGPPAAPCRRDNGREVRGSGRQARGVGLRGRVSGRRSDHGTGQDRATPRRGRPGRVSIGTDNRCRRQSGPPLPGRTPMANFDPKRTLGWAVDHLEDLAEPHHLWALLNGPLTASMDFGRKARP